MDKIDVFIKELQELCAQYDAELCGSRYFNMVVVSVEGKEHDFHLINKNEAVKVA